MENQCVHGDANCTRESGAHNVNDVAPRHWKGYGCRDYYGRRPMCEHHEEVLAHHNWHDVGKNTAMPSDLGAPVWAQRGAGDRTRRRMPGTRYRAPL